MQKRKICILISLFFILTGVTTVFSTTTDEFLRTDFAKQRNTRETAYKLLAYISNQLVQRPDYDEANWLHAAMLYFIGDYYETNFAKKKELFTMTKDFALKAVQLNPESADAHYWLAVGYGKWSQANGILDSLFYADDIFNEISRTIELRPGFFRGVAFGIRATVLDLAPGWPLSIGNKEMAYQDIKTALQFGPDFRFNYQMYAEILINDGYFEEAKKVIEKGLSLPYDTYYPREEDKIINDLKKDLAIVNSRLNVN